MATLATWDVGIALTGDVTGIFRIGTSTIGGVDVIGNSFSGATYTDVTASAKRVEIERGRNGHLDRMQEGRCKITLHDPDGTFNPENPASPYVGNLVPLRVVRVRSFHPDYAQTVLNDGPVGYWRFGERAGTVAADSSGNGGDGTYTGGYTLAQAGALTLDGDNDTALLLNGSTGYVAVPSSSAISTGDTITIEFWIKRTAIPGSGVQERFLNKGTDGTGYEAWMINNLVVLGVYGVANMGNISTTITDTTTWHHIVLVHAPGTFHGYIDGVEASTNIAPSTVITDNTAPLAIGAVTGGGGAFLNAQIDEVAIYPTALSGARVLAHYQAGKRTGGDTKTRGHYFGFTENIEHDPTPGVKETVIECVDLFEFLTAATPTIGSTGATTTGAAIGLILNAIDWTDPALRDLDTGGAIPDFSADGSKSALALIEELLTTDIGVFFIDGSGVATYRDRRSRFAAGYSLAAFTDTLIGTARPGTSLRRIINRQVVTRTGGTPQEAVDAPSRRAYGYRDGSAITSENLLSDTQAGNLAAFLVLLQKDPLPPTRGLRVQNISDAATVQQLTRGLNDRVTISETEGGTETEGTIEGVKLQIEQGYRVVNAEFVISKRAFPDFFTIGTSTLGGNHIIGY